MFNWTKSDAMVLGIAIGLIVLLAVVFRRFFSEKSEFVRKLPLRFLAVFIVALEISKQLTYLIEYLNGVPYNLYALPAHFCSTFIWFIPLAQFTRGKAAKIFHPMPFIYSFFVVVLLYAYPQVLLGNATAHPFNDFFTVHTLLFHHAIVAYFIFSIALKDYSPCKADLLPLIGGIVLYAAYAVPIAYTLHVNYVNILRSDFSPFEALRTAIGKTNYVLGQVVYDAMLFVLATGVAVGLCAILIIIKARAGSREGLKRLEQEIT